MEIILSTLSTSLEEGQPNASVKVRLYSPLRMTEQETKTVIISSLLTNYDLIICPKYIKMCFLHYEIIH